MKLDVLVEPMNGSGFRARTGEPFGITVEAATREEALKKLQDGVQARMTAGAEFLTLDVPGEANPWLKISGVFKDHPWLEEWKQAVEEYRNQVDQDPDYP